MPSAGDEASSTDLEPVAVGTHAPGRSTAEHMRRWLPGRLWFRGILAILAVLALVPTASTYLASRMLANASPPTGVEFPSTPAPQLASGIETTSLAGQGRGLNCSIPLLVERVAFRHTGNLANPSSRYRQACVAHDLCYRHGAATYGYTQADCDQMLMRAAFRMCKKRDDQKRSDDRSAGNQARSPEDEDRAYGTCVDEARMVYFGVFLGGATSYRPIEPRNGGAIARGDGSGPAEYDPYPAGGASYAVARLVTGDATSLLLFRRSPGGGRYIRWDWTGAGFGAPITAPLPGRWEDQPAPPFVARGSEGRPDELVWWRRATGIRFPTYGSFAAAPATAFSGRSTLSVDAALPTLDPGSSQFFPVPGASPDGMLHLIGVTEFPGTWDRCGVKTKAIQVVHVTLALHRVGGHPSYRCVIYQVPRNGDGGPGRPERVGSYLGEPPVLAFDGQTIRVTLFRRDGERRASDYRDLLSGLTVRIPLNDGGSHRPETERRCWRLSESEEPFFAPAGGTGLLATLTFSGPDGEIDPDKDPRAALFLRTASPSPSGSSGYDGGKDVWRLPAEARSYLRARVIHLQTGPGSAVRVSNATDALVMTRVSEVGGKLQGSALVVTLNGGTVVACTQSFFDLPATLVAREGEGLRRAAALQPIVGDLNRDGSPDLVLADTSGGAPFGLLGVDGGGGRLGFAPTGSGTPHVANARCEHVR